MLSDTLLVFGLPSKSVAVTASVIACAASTAGTGRSALYAFGALSSATIVTTLPLPSCTVTDVTPTSAAVAVTRTGMTLSVPDWNVAFADGALIVTDGAFVSFSTCTDVAAVTGLWPGKPSSTAAVIASVGPPVALFGIGMLNVTPFAAGVFGVAVCVTAAALPIFDVRVIFVTATSSAALTVAMTVLPG